ncbi:MAG: hypothetical protein Ta2A_18260 [Treponemataceae bacterium]|nr:MAG: hypothetical protein Ta2A_18260 [Treponemataceae bacterium]
MKKKFFCAFILCCFSVFTFFAEGEGDGAPPTDGSSDGNPASTTGEIKLPDPAPATPQPPAKSTGGTGKSTPSPSPKTVADPKKELTDKKGEAKDKLKNYFENISQDNYSEEQKQTLASAKNSGDAAIDAVGKIADIDQTLVDAKKKIEEVAQTIQNEINNEKHGNSDTEVNGDEPVLDVAIEEIENLKKTIFLRSVIAIALFFVVIAVIVLLFFKKLNATIEKLEDKLKKMKGDLELQLGDFKQNSSTANHTPDPYGMQQMSRRIADVEDQLQKIKNQQKQEQAVQPPAEPVLRQTGNPVADFNAWAANPVSRLPSGFHYVIDDIRILTTYQNIKSGAETKWISNESGAQKYLFPNPTLLNQMSDIGEFYTMPPSGFNAKGQNRINITKPCEMTNTGYITYRGELRLL